jgi:hypothetical protein
MAIVLLSLCSQYWSMSWPVSSKMLWQGYNCSRKSNAFSFTLTVYNTPVLLFSNNIYSTHLLASHSSSSPHFSISYHIWHTSLPNYQLIPTILAITTPARHLSFYHLPHIYDQSEHSFPRAQTTIGPCCTPAST